MTSLSTHVLDTERGIPAAGVRVTLYRGQSALAEGVTEPNGRIADLGGGALDHGAYRLEFDVSTYLAAQGRPAPFLQRVILEFVLDASQPHYHVPLLMTPYAFTSYRGS
jgi:5-hydroxyisourate hydrolase